MKTSLVIATAMLALLVAWVVAGEKSAVTFNELGEKTPDGRFGTQCAGITGKFRNVCDVSFYRLLAETERYHGRPVSLSGFLVEIDGDLVLFPNQESYVNGAHIDGVQLQGRGAEDSALKARAARGLKGATATGYFDAHFTGSGMWRSGALRNVQHVGVMPRDPASGVPVPPKRP